MSKDVVCSFSRDYKLEVVRRMESGENISALARELAIKREILYRWLDAHRLGGPSALRVVGRPSKAEATEMAESRSTAGKVNDLAEARWQIERLQRKIGQQQLDLDFFKQALRLVKVPPVAEQCAWRNSVFAHIQAMTLPQGCPPASVERMCKLAGVSRLAYYRDWQKSVPLVAETELRSAMQRLVLANRHYGYHRIGVLLRREGHVVNHKKINGLMREDNLLCLRKPAFRPSTTDSNHRWRVWPNLARRITPMAANRLWVADITYVHLAESFVYLAVVLDAYSRKVIGWALADHLRAELALDALEMALTGRDLLAGELITIPTGASSTLAATISPGWKRLESSPA